MIGLIRSAVMCAVVVLASAVVVAQNITVNIGGTGNTNLTNDNGTAVSPTVALSSCLSSNVQVTDNGSTGVTVRITTSNGSGGQDTGKQAEIGVTAGHTSDPITFTGAGCKVGSFYIWIETKAGWQMCGTIQLLAC